MFILPELKYSYTSYEPHIDAQTMEIHHQMHHAGYVKKLNQALIEHDIHVDTIEDIFERISELPEVIRNNAGGHYNHTVFWKLLDVSMSVPSSELLEQINKYFGVLEDFKAEFIKAGLEVFGSGWVWLVVSDDGSLNIVTTKNQDNPLMKDIYSGYPILGIDVWEHAYYLKHQNRRVEYLKGIWALINWDEVSRRHTERPTLNNLA